MKNPETPFIFFTGKGGVLKTFLSCATAIKLADQGNRVLLVSTDPASNLEDVLESRVYDKIASVRGLKNIYAINIDPEVSAREYRERHTLRLLELPAAWAGFSEKNPDKPSCLGPTSALKSNQERYNAVVSRLRNPEMASFYLVARADQASLREASRTSEELIELGMNNQNLLVNGVFSALDKTDDFAFEMENLEKTQMSDLPENLRKLDLQNFPLLPYNILEIEKLRSLPQVGLQKKMLAYHLINMQELNHSLLGMEELVEDLTANKTNGLIMCKGKGGVGKTIAAAALAIMIARKGFEVHLPTTDPAAHVQDFMNQVFDLPPNLSIDRIDPKLETQQYTEKIVSQKGKDLDEQGKKLSLEDLRSPCTEEVAVLQAFSKAIQQAKRNFVVIDTAPTGHTLLLLDTAGGYHREVLKNTGLDPSHINPPLYGLTG